MKKKLLFVIPSLSAGGGEKSLVNLLRQINYDVYDVDVMLFSKSGLFLKLVPEEVNVIELDGDYQIFSKPLLQSMQHFLTAGRFTLAYARLMFFIKNKMMKNKARAEQYTWKYISRSISVGEREYEAAIAFLEKSSIYFIIDKVKSNNKIGWVHTNYANSGMDKRFDDSYVRQLQTVVTVSEECASSLQEHFPHAKEKLRVIYNIVSPKMIRALAREEDARMPDKEIGTTVVTVARLSHEKGIDMAVRSCRLLVERGYNIQWLVLGDGSERHHLQELIREYGVAKHFRLLGLKENPYPFVNRADIYVQPSRYEGKSIAIDEAKILYKPIVVTNFETAKDQIQDGVNGLIVDMNEEGICAGIERLIQDERLRYSLTNRLKKESFGTEEEINKLYDIL